MYSVYETCIFDLYGTLVDIRTDESSPLLWEKMTLFYACYGAQYLPDELRQLYERLVDTFGRGKKGIRNDVHESHPEIRIEDVFSALFSEKGVSADESLVRQAGQFFRILSIEHIRLYDGTKEMLSALRDNGQKIYLLSNAQKLFTEYEMNALRLTPYFEGIFISSEHGVKKPDPAFFSKLIDQYHILPERAIMVGNDGVCDIEGAKRTGLSTLYVRTEISPEEETPQADYVLARMDMRKIREILTGEPQETNSDGRTDEKESRKA